MINNMRLIVNKNRMASRGRRPPASYQPESDGEEGVVHAPRLTFDVVDGPGAAPVRDDDSWEIGDIEEDEDKAPEPCVACTISADNQSHPGLQKKVAQIEKLINMSSAMGMKYKVDQVFIIYEETLLPLLMAEQPIGADGRRTEPVQPFWSKRSIRNHMRGLHGTASTTTLKQVDIAAMGTWMDMLGKFAVKRRKKDGKIVGVNESIYKLRIKMSTLVQSLPENG